MVDLEKKVNELDNKLNALISVLQKNKKPEVKLFPSAYIKDDLGYEFHDDLTGFMRWYFEECPNKFQVPFDNPLLFIEGHTACTLFRHGAYQVELVYMQPDTVTYDHNHPDVDSYVVYLYGTNFRFKGKEVLSKQEGHYVEKNGKASAYMRKIRLKPNTVHGAESGPNGACFFSVQKWLSGKAGESIANSWNGEELGEEHAKGIR
jgi:quercetin dioxygenase-like cupin family protein